MRLTAWRLLAAVSVLVACASAATRPRYGGTLRVQMREWTDSLDPAAADDSPAKERLAALLFDRLTRLDASGKPQPALAVSWQYDAARRRWIYNLRDDVRFQDGSELTAQAAAALLGGTVQGGAISLAADRGPVEVAGMRYSVVRRAADGMLIGTGPFKLTQWEPGKRALLAAFDEYWGGRPYLDSIQVEMGRSGRAADLELDRADVVELPLNEARRAAASWSSPANQLLAIVFDHPDARVREALALSIDRASMHTVLLQRQGAPTGALLPQWLTGYAHLFAADRDLNRARELARSTVSLTLAFDPLDPAARAIAERIGVNAREAGIVVRPPAPGANADARLIRLRISSLDPARALADLGADLKQPEVAALNSIDARYAQERAWLDGYRIVPLFHLPETFGLGKRVRNWRGWSLEDVWLTGEAQP